MAAPAAKKRLSLAVVGHPGCGKSTLMGHLLYALGNIDQDKYKATEAKAAERDRRSSRYAMVHNTLLSPLEHYLENVCSENTLLKRSILSFCSY